MDESDPPRMERLAGEGPQRGGERRVADLPPPRLAVDRIADDRPPARREVDADLVRAAGDQAGAEQ